MKKVLEYLKKHSFYAMIFVLAVGILAVSGIAGYVSGQRERQAAENAAEFKEKTAQQMPETSEAASAKKNEVADEADAYNADVVQKILSMIEDGTIAPEDFEDENSEKEVTKETEAEETEAVEDMVAEAGTTENAGFNPEDGMEWPVNGEVIKPYSMDTTIYYPTLKEYKCNPAILIQGETGEAVRAASAGTVIDIYDDDELGKVVETSLGNGYQAKYGQLQQINVAVGDHVSEGQAIAEVAEPTRFYSVEGTHVNFEVTKDGSPVDPLEYLSYQ